MIARWVMLNLPRGSRSTVESVAAETKAAYERETGFRGLTVLLQGTLGQFAFLSMWETNEQAEAAGKIPVPERHQYIAPLLQGPAVVRIFEVWEP